MARGKEADRLDEARQGEPWKRWGPYLAERQWGTVREDYSADGEAWSYFTHDQARSRAYKWGEDGIAGLCDDRQRLCFAVALWNGRDPILKERMFGLTNNEGNHGEDVKEYWFHLDATPTGSYLAYRYRYPLAAFPYDDLVATNRARGKLDFEYELIDTGVFAGDRYVDVDVEYAKAAPEDVHVRITLTNRGGEAALVHLLPTLWFRNTWWMGGPRGELAVDGGGVAVRHPDLADLVLTAEGDPEWLFTENETNSQRLWGTPNATPYVKDAFHDYVVAGRADAVNPARSGTKAAAHHRLEVPAGGSVAVRLRLAPAGAAPLTPAAVDELVAARRAESDEFYASLTPAAVPPADATVMRRALAGMLWGKQHYHYDLDRWLNEHGVHPLRDDGGGGAGVRNQAWFHMLNDDVISMPDTWEYPWYASWDLAFHAVALAMVDVDEAKAQLGLMLRELYLHPNGQLPAYEWNFGDVNPPVHAWATLVVYEAELEQRGTGDTNWLAAAFQKLLLNFTWWINRKDPTGRNVFEGGFLGLDNIGVFDRSAPLPTGGRLEQSDGTAWMAFFAESMLGIAVELSRHDPVYEDMVPKFAEHFAFIAAAMDRIGDNHDDLWDEEDGFFYDVLRLPDGRAERLKVRSIVGLMPLCASAILPLDRVALSDDVQDQMRRRIDAMPELLATIHDPRVPGVHGRRMLAVLNADKLRRVLARMLDEDEFLSPHGLRALSRYHAEHPFTFDAGGSTYEVRYLPAESDTGMFGGNSNWRGPVWMPINYLILRGLLNLYAYYGDDFTVECPTGSGHQCTLFEVAVELGRRLAAIFTPGPDGRRPLYGGNEVFQTDPHWKDMLVFNEYFHGDNGAGLGASHQTGWTGLVARIVQTLGYLQPGDLTDRARPVNFVYGSLPGVSAWPAHPAIYEVNTAAWLHDVGLRAGGGPATLAEVPAGEWDRVTPAGVDAVWLMGVWERSPAGARIALDSPEQMAGLREALPDLVGADVIGSAYCVRRYEVDARFGGRAGLAAARAALAARGVRLVVDFVPNHVAPDHPWLDDHPERFVRGTAEDLARDPAGFLAAGDAVVARGRDPFFPPWPDVAQLDLFAPGLRAAAAATLSDIAGQADGVRCDMAMLALSDVFARTWGARVGPPPAAEYWAEVIGAVRAARADFLFVAEAYWDREADLVGLGFDHCYDKRLYDRLVAGEPDPAGVRAHLTADPAYQRRLVRFLENHDEPRAAAVLAPERERAAAVAVATLPGATLWHEGQFEGWRVRVPVFLGRRPAEPVDHDLRAFHLGLVAAVAGRRRGDWAPAAATGWPGDASCEGLTAWVWRDGDVRTLVVVNDAAVPAAARVHVAGDGVAGRAWRLDDLLSGASYERDGHEIAGEGLYVQLPPWGCHVLAWEAAPEPGHTG